MGKIVWTPLRDRYLRRFYAGTETKILAARLNCSAQAIKSRANRLKYKKQNRLNNYKMFTDVEIRYVRRFYPTGDVRALAKKLNITVPVLYQKATALGVARDTEMVMQRNRELGAKLAEMNLGSRFVPGQTAYNKGKKQSEFMSPEDIAKTKATRFVAGQDPHNTKPIGYERINIDGYTEVKVRHGKSHKNNFEQKHRIVWIEHHGPIPEGMIIEFIDGDKQNFSIHNLRMVTRRENVLRNTFSDTSIAKRVFKERNPERIKEIVKAYPEVIELKRTAIRLNSVLRERKKQRNGKQ